MHTEDFSSRAFDLAVIGEVNVDLILKGDVVPAFGQVEQIASEADLVMGSSAVIFACGAARLGLKTVFIGKVGDDLFGKFMVDSMNQRGIDTSGIVLDPLIKTGISVILAKQSDRAILTYPGSIPELTFQDINFEIISNCKHLHLSGYFLLDKLKRDATKLFMKAKEAGLSLSLDTNYDPSGRWDDGLQELLPLTDVFLPNDAEAKAISNEINLEAAIQKLTAVVPTLGVKLGIEGAITRWRGYPQIKRKALPVDVVDTVGAGDSFDAGFIYGYLQGWSPERTLHLAITCGSLSTLKSGGTEGQVSIDEAMVVMERNGE